MSSRPTSFSRPVTPNKLSATSGARDLSGPLSFGAGSPARLGFGAWAVGGAGWGDPADESERLAAIERAVAGGVTFFDTAPTYGESEVLLGKALISVRDRVAIATKVGPHDDPRATLEASLRRFGFDRVDLLQLHEVGPGFERSLESMNELLNEGKTGAIGLCNATARQIARALDIAPIATYQGPYNLFDRDVEQRELPLCRDRGLGFIAYRPLASGLLAGGPGTGPPVFAAGDHRERIYWFKGLELERRRRVAEGLRALADERGLSPSALALSWALARPGVTVVLAGARTAEQVEQNLQAMTALADEDTVGRIDALVTGVFAPARRVPGAELNASWGPRERFIVEHLDGETPYEAVAAEWSDDNEVPMIGAQVKLFVDQLLEQGLATYETRHD